MQSLWVCNGTSYTMQYPRTFSTDLITSSCKMLKEATLLGLQEPSRPWGPPVGWHFPHDAEQLQCKQRQLYHGKVVILLAALCVDRDHPPLCGIVQAGIEHDELLCVLYPQGVIID